MSWYFLSLLLPLFVGFPGFKFFFTVPRCFSLKSWKSILIKPVLYKSRRMVMATTFLMKIKSKDLDEMQHKNRIFSVRTVKSQRLSKSVDYFLFNVPLFLYKYEIWTKIVVRVCLNWGKVQFKSQCFYITISYLIDFLVWHLCLLKFRSETEKNSYTETR